MLTSAMLYHGRHAAMSSVMHLGPAHVRFVHDVDGVSDIPLPSSHIAPPRYFDITGGSGMTSRCGSCFVDHWKAPGKYGGLEGYKTHGMRHYLEALDGFITHTGVRPRDPLATAGG